MSSLQVLTPAAAGRHFDFAELVAFDSADLVARAAGIAQAAGDAQTEIAQAARPGLGKKLPQTAKLAGVVAAARLEVRPAPEMVASGIAEIDALSGGLPRGCLTEICGPASSGRTSLLLAAMAAATQREEVCALVDVSDALDPRSAAAAGVDLKKILWVRCGIRHPASGVRNSESGTRRPASGFGRPAWGMGLLEEHRGEFLALENALRVTDLLLQSSGFGMVVIDVGDISLRAARRVPLTSWFRFRRAVENTNTVLLVSSRQSCAQTCASLVVEMRASGGRHQASGIWHPASGFGLPASGRELSAFSHQPGFRRPAYGSEVLRFAQDFGTLGPASGVRRPAPGRELSAKNYEREPLPTHAEILEGLSVEAEVVRSRVERKPAQSEKAGFESRTAWGGG